MVIKIINIKKPRNELQIKINHCQKSVEIQVHVRMLNVLRVTNNVLQFTNDECSTCMY